MQNKFFRYLLFFLGFLIIFQLIGQKQSNNGNLNDDITLSLKSKPTIGKEVIVNIKNNAESPITISNKCPENPLLVEFYDNGEWKKLSVELEDSSKCEKNTDVTIAQDETKSIAFGLWSQPLFKEVGKYRISYETLLNGKAKNYYLELELKEPSFIKKIWNAALYKPIFNTLFYLIAKMPGNNLGLAIILLTVIIKLILLGPNQKALKSQRQLQLVQPQLDALKEKYKNEPQKLASETMAIWKKHKVSPMGSCLPMLIQFPILIALFYVVRDGLSVTNTDLFYDSMKSFDPSTINPHFLGLNLAMINYTVLPVIVAALQFVQIRLSLGKGKKAEKTSNASPMPMMNQMMKYMLPLMIAIFTASLPAAVGFYWGTSTLFAIGQQLVVNRSKSS